MKKYYKPRKPQKRKIIKHKSSMYLPLKSNINCSDDDNMTVKDLIDRIKKETNNTKFEKIKVKMVEEYFAEDWTDRRFEFEWKELEPIDKYRERINKYKEKLKLYKEYKELTEKFEKERK